MNITTVGSEELLLLGQVLTVAGDDALGVEHHNILYLCTQSHIELGTADGCSSGSVDYDLYVSNIFACYLKGILETCSRDDGCAMLIVVHHRNVKGALESVLYIEALWSLDVLKIDSTEGRSNFLYSFAEFLGVFLCHLDVEHVDSTINFKQQTLSFHYRLATHGTNVAKSQYGCSVTDNRH